MTDFANFGDDDRRRRLGEYNTSAEEASMERFTNIMAREGWVARPRLPDETETDTDIVFVDKDGRGFVAWEEGSLIGSGHYPEELQSVFAFYEEGTHGYRRQNEGDDYPEEY